MNSSLSMDNNYVDDNNNMCVFSLASNKMHRDKWKVNLSIFGNDYDRYTCTMHSYTISYIHIFPQQAPYAY